MDIQFLKDCMRNILFSLVYEGPVIDGHQYRMEYGINKDFAGRIVDRHPDSPFESGVLIKRKFSDSLVPIFKSISVEPIISKT
jgi:hypothetical protein